MISANQIREDLKNIRYYYLRETKFKDGVLKVGKHNIFDVKEKYNKAVCLAPPRLYDLYMCLYVENGTQESVAEYLGYSPEYIRLLNKKLIKYFKEYLDNSAKTVA